MYVVSIDLTMISASINMLQFNLFLSNRLYRCHNYVLVSSPCMWCPSVKENYLFKGEVGMAVCGSKKFSNKGSELQSSNPLPSPILPNYELLHSHDRPRWYKGSEVGIVSS